MPPTANSLATVLFEWPDHAAEISRPEPVKDLMHHHEARAWRRRFKALAGDRLVDIMTGHLSMRIIYAKIFNSHGR
jgi:hypothetical protein